MRGFISEPRFLDPTLPFLRFLGQLPALLTGCERRIKERKDSLIPPHGLCRLDDKTLAGTISFESKENWQSRGETHIEMKEMRMGYGGSNGDPDTPPPREKRSFRVGDLYAYCYSQYQNGPKFQLFWPESKRDAGILPCRKWLEVKNRPENLKH